MDPRSLLAGIGQLLTSCLPSCDLCLPSLLTYEKRKRRLQGCFLSPAVQGGTSVESRRNSPPRNSDPNVAEARVVCAPKGPQQISPGQRPTAVESRKQTADDAGN